MRFRAAHRPNFSATLLARTAHGLARSKSPPSPTPYRSSHTDGDAGRLPRGVRVRGAPPHFLCFRAASPTPSSSFASTVHACHSQVQRSELESIKPGARVWERKASLFFLSSKEAALAHNEEALTIAKATAAQEEEQRAAREADEQAQRERAWP